VAPRKYYFCFGAGDIAFWQLWSVPSQLHPMNDASAIEQSKNQSFTL
jgi:hypothetical protein